MITAFRFLDGYPVNLATIGKRRFCFNDRLNLVIGPNGSGKTTLLHYLALAVGCGQGGWSRSEEARRPFGVELEWDQWPVFYQNCYQMSDKSFINSAYFETREYLRSTGEKRIGLLNELFNYLEERFLTYKLKPRQRPSLILDEVDNHIGIVGQAIFWKEVVPWLIKKYQVIVSSHSVFPILLQKNTLLRQDNIITLDRDYLDLCLKTLGDAIDQYNR